MSQSDIFKLKQLKEALEELQKVSDSMLEVKTGSRNRRANSTVPNYNSKSVSQRNAARIDFEEMASISTLDSDCNPSESFSMSRIPMDTSSDTYYQFYADEYIDFTYENPTIYHVVDYVSNLLEEHGFVYLSENQPWESPLKSGLYYTTRNSTSLSCFAIGSDWTPEDGVGIVGGHIDVLTTKLKPNSKKEKVEGFELLGVAPYSGALSEQWWDRDLHIGGNVLIRDSSSGKVYTKLIQSEYPVARIPSLAPHFGQAFSSNLNKETRAVPVIGFGNSKDSEKLTPDEKKCPLTKVHSINLLRFIAELAEVEVKDLVQLDLDLYDGQKGTIGGIKKDFLFAPRIDDRICSFTAIYGFLQYLESNQYKIRENEFSVVTLYDNEEIGSNSRQGAKGGLSESVIERVIDNYITDKKNYSLDSFIKVAYANSFILSSDVNHAFNPNFTDVYLENHRPLLNTGMTIAFDESSFATDVIGNAMIQDIARLNGDTLQLFHIRNDSRSGSTIGPHISANTGARTIDLGIAQWSMHSIRAAVGSKDVGISVKFFFGFFQHWDKVSNNYKDIY